MREISMLPVKMISKSTYTAVQTSDKQGKLMLPAEAEAVPTHCWAGNAVHKGKQLLAAYAEESCWSFFRYH